MSRLSRILSDYRLKRAAIVLAVAGLVVWMVIRNNRAKAGGPTEVYDGESTPTMVTLDAHCNISDSGYTRYHVDARLWEIYNDADDPYWQFDSGLYLEQYDKSMAVIATFECDSARYRSNPQIWEFVGNVRINNPAGDKFLTEQMYYDTHSRKMYSDSFIHIERTDRIIEGYGFESDERLEDYVVRRPSMILPVSDFRRVTPASSATSEQAAPSSVASTTGGSVAQAPGTERGKRELRLKEGAEIIPIESTDYSPAR